MIKIYSSFIISLVMFSGLSVSAEDLLSLHSFKEESGWSMVKGGEVNSVKPKEFILQKGGGKILSNGHKKNKAAYLTTKKGWADQEIHAEFMIPKDSNSGFYLLGRYEIQVLDSHGVEEVTSGDMGGLYQRWDKELQKKNLEAGFEGVPPLVNAALPYGEWQTINIKFRAPRFDEKGTKTAHAHFVEVTINGQVVQKDVDAKGPTRAAPLSGEEASGPLAIQGNHGPILLRKLEVQTRDYSDIQVPKISQRKRSLEKPAGKPQVDLVKLGEKAF